MSYIVRIKLDDVFNFAKLIKETYFSTIYITDYYTRITESACLNENIPTMKSSLGH